MFDVYTEKNKETDDAIYFKLVKDMEGDIGVHLYDVDGIKFATVGWFIKQGKFLRNSSFASGMPDRYKKQFKLDHYKIQVC